MPSWFLLGQRRIHAHVVALASYIVLTLAWLWPLPVHMTDRVIWGSGDSWQVLWNLWWVRQVALGRFPQLYHTPLLHYGEGTPLYLHDFHPINGLLAVPVAAFGNEVLALNLLTVLWTVLAAYVAFILALRASGSLIGGLLAGAIFAMAPDRMAHIFGGHQGLVTVVSIPCFVLSLSTYLETGCRRWLIGVGLSMALAVLSHWYYVLFLGLFGLVWGTLRLIWLPDGLKRVVILRRLVAAGTLTLLVAVPAAAFIALNAPPLNDQLTPLELATMFRADPQAFLLPSSLHPLFGPAVEPLRQRFTYGLTENSIYLGYSIITLAALGVWQRRSTRIWLAVGSIFALLALGPVLTWGGQPVRLPGGTPIQLPYVLLTEIPLANIARVPARLAVLTQLCLAVLAAHGAAVLLRSASGRALLAVLVVAGVIEYLPGVILGVPPPPPAFYRQLASDPEEYGVLDLPSAIDANLLGRYMWYQTTHHKGIYEAYLSRQLPFLLTDAVGLPLHANGSVDDIDHAQAQAALVAAGYRYVVLHKRDAATAGALAQEAVFANLPVVVDDREVRVRRLPAGPRLGAFPVAGWYGEEQQADLPFRWLRSPAISILVGSDHPLLLSFNVVAAVHQTSTLQLSLDEHLLPPITVQAGRSVVIGPLRSVSGTSRLTLRVLEGNVAASTIGAGRDSRRLSLAIGNLHTVLVRGIP